MANNRELSQFGNFISVNDTSENIGISTDVIISGVLTATRYYGDGSQLTGIATVGGGTTLGITTISQLTVTGITTLGSVSATSLSVSGASTFGNIFLNPVGIITANVGVVTYYGDGSKLTGVISGVGIKTAGGTVGSGATVLDFRGSGISTVTVGSGIGTIFIQGGGGGGSVSISSVAPTSPSSGDLWYSIDYGRTFVYYDEVVLGVGSSAFWVDAAPFNVNLSQFDSLSVANLTVNNTTKLLGVTTANVLNVTGVTTLSTLNVTGVTALSTLNVAGIATLTSLNVANVNSSGIVTAVDFNSTSDINLKENINTIDSALETVNQLRGVSFDWKDTGRRSYGVIAQEIEKILPELVSNSDIKTVNYNGIIGVLIEAVKELSAEIEELKSNK
jgi:hypothetical protein